MRKNAKQSVSVTDKFTDTETNFGYKKKSPDSPFKTDSELESLRRRVKHWNRRLGASKKKIVAEEVVNYLTHPESFAKVIKKDPLWLTFQAEVVTLRVLSDLSSFPENMYSNWARDFLTAHGLSAYIQKPGIKTIQEYWKYRPTELLREVNRIKKLLVQASAEGCPNSNNHGTRRAVESGAEAVLTKSHGNRKKPLYKCCINHVFKTEVGKNTPKNFYNEIPSGGTHITNIALRIISYKYPVKSFSNLVRNIYNDARKIKLPHNS